MISSIQWIIKILRHLLWHFIHMPAFVSQQTLSINRLPWNAERETISIKAWFMFFILLSLLEFLFHCFIMKDAYLSFTWPHLFHLYITHGTSMTCIKILQACCEVKDRQREGERDRYWFSKMLYGDYMNEF